MSTKAKPVLLQNWSVCFRYAGDDIYKAPELDYEVLAGEVYGHPRFPDGKGVKTSGIVSVVGRQVTTRGGTTYRLGKVQKEYRDWLKKEGHVYNPRKPISIKGKQDD